MAQEPDNLVLIQLRELREVVERRFESLTLDIAAMREELRETRSSNLGLAHLVSLLSGDLRAEFQRVNERLERLERERA
jgi:hypothetical protein